MRRNRVAGLALAAAFLGVACTTEVVNFAPTPIGSGFARYVRFSCCEPTDFTACTVEVLGDAATCNDPGIWKNQAGIQCMAQGLTMTMYSLYVECGPASDGAVTDAK